MKIASKDFIGLPVQTVSGRHLGKVGGFEMDAESGQILTVFVKTGGLLGGILDQELAIHWSQVTECNQEVLIVEDLVVSDAEKASADAVLPPKATTVANGYLNEEGSVD